MKRSTVFFVTALGILFLFVTTLSAQVPQLINYQGILKDPNTGDAISGSKSMTFSIYSVSSGGTALWTETQTVSVDNGYFSTSLGSTTQIPYSVFSGGDCYLGVKVGTDAEMTPRKRIVSVGYALRSHDADKVGGKDASAFAPVVHNHDSNYYTKSELNTSDGNPPNSGSNRVSWNNLKDVPAGFADGTDDVGAAGGISQVNVGTGMTVTNPTGPTTTLGLNMGHGNNIDADKVDGKHAADFALSQELSTNDGTVNQSGDPVSWYKIKDMPAGFADGADNAGTVGGITQINVGAGMTVTNPTGPTTSLGLNMGHGNNINADMVDGKHASNFAAASHPHSGVDITSGKIGNARLNTGSGNGLDADMVDGKHASDFVTSTHNHLGQIWNMGSSSTNGLYMQGTIPWANSLIKTENYGSGPGIYGINRGGGNGVRGQTNGTGIGVYGQCDHSGPGAVGRSGSGNGVEGYGDSGLYGEGATYGGWAMATGTDGIGLLGLANSGSNSMGIKGMSSNGYAGYFWGKVHVLTTLSKGAGSFKIDHPVDPANKYLYHSFVESPDMMNIYNGNVTLDANGEAIVEMPDWFKALNKDFRYQLTAIGGPGPNLYIAEEISGNHFRIAGGSPGMRVSWQVTGIRNDAFAKVHRIPVEEEKPAKEQGKYLHPKERGLPESMGIDFEENRRIEEKVQKMKERREKAEILKLE